MRAKSLRFTGKHDANGQPDRWFSGVPARDLSEREVKGLSDEEYANITGGESPLYVAVTSAAPKTPARKRPSRAKKAAASPKTTTPKPPANVAPKQTPVAGRGAVEEPPPAQTP